MVLDILLILFWGWGKGSALPPLPGTALSREVWRTCKDFTRETGTVTISMISHCCHPLLETEYHLLIYHFSHIKLQRL